MHGDDCKWFGGLRGKWFGGGKSGGVTSGSVGKFGSEGLMGEVFVPSIDCYYAQGGAEVAWGGDVWMC